MIICHFHHFRVHQNQLQFFRREPEKKTHDQRIHAHTLTTAGGTGDQQMRSFGKVQNSGFASHVFPQHNGDLRLAGSPFRRFHHRPHEYRFRLTVGNFHPHHGTARDRGKNTDAYRRKIHFDIVFNAGDFADRHPLIQFDLIAGDAGAGNMPLHRTGYTETVHRLLQTLFFIPDLFRVFPGGFHPFPQLENVGQSIGSLSLRHNGFAADRDLGIQFRYSYRNRFNRCFRYGLHRFDRNHRFGLHSRSRFFRFRSRHTPGHGCTQLINPAHCRFSLLNFRFNFRLFDCGRFRRRFRFRHRNRFRSRRNRFFLFLSGRSCIPG